MDIIIHGWFCYDFTENDETSSIHGSSLALFVQCLLKYWVHQDPYVGCLGFISHHRCLKDPYVIPHFPTWQQWRFKVTGWVFSGTSDNFGIFRGIFDVPVKSGGKQLVSTLPQSTHWRNVHPTDLPRNLGNPMDLLEPYFPPWRSRGDFWWAMSKRHVKRQFFGKKHMFFCRFYGHRPMVILIMVRFCVLPKNWWRSTSTKAI